MANFAIACGAYGFVRMALTSTGYGSQTSELSFSSNHRFPQIDRDKHCAARGRA